MPQHKHDIAHMGPRCVYVRIHACTRATNGRFDASEEGHSAVVKMLLDDNRDHRALPDAKDSSALQRAVKNGHSNVVKLLLDDSREHRALPDDDENWSLGRAPKDGNTEVVKMLLGDSREHRSSMDDNWVWHPIDYTER